LTYEPRVYRNSIRDRDLVSFNVVAKETDLYIRAQTNLKRKAARLVLKHRSLLEKYIAQHPAFQTSLEPLPLDSNAPHIVQMMLEAAGRAGVGPMAGVAGAIAELVGKELTPFSSEIIVENGGDIYLKTTRQRRVGIYAGKSPLTGKIGLIINAADTPLGICTSSGTVGHSLSYGTADAVTVLSESTTLADAAATAIGNSVKQPHDLNKGIELAQTISGLKGVIIIIGSNLGLWGQVNLCQTAA
jgi:ApbE superfamily uncharacterized protein (UPF0280 family)